MQVLNLDADLNISRLDADIRTLRLGEGGTTNYNDLTNKPSINSVTLTGNKTTSDLNIKTSDLINDEGFITNADIPTKTSDLTNDSGFQTAAQVSSAVAAAIPTNVSSFTNDAGYITAAQVGNIPTKTSDLTNDSGFITSAEAPVQSVNGYTGAVDLDGSNLDYDAGNSINDKIDAVEAAIPAKTSDLTNDSGFITAAGVPSKTSDLINDSGFITSADIPTDVSAFTNDAGYQTAANVNTLIQAAMPATETIENESVASFSDGADNVPVSELIVDIDADAGGFSSVNVVVGGKNLFDADLLLDQLGWHTFTLFNGLPNTEYTISSNLPSEKTSELPCYVFNSTGNPSASNIVYSGQSVTVTTNADGIITCQQRRVSGTDSFSNYEWQLEKGSTATTYEPYIGSTTYTITLGETLTQGGVLNVTTGLLTRTDSTTAQFTPTEVRTLLGDNINIYADTGDINKLVYFKTGCEAIARLIEAYT